METQFTYHIGQTLRIKEGVFRGKTFTLLGEEDRMMSSGTISVPRYHCQGNWYYEEEVEPVNTAHLLPDPSM